MWALFLDNFLKFYIWPDIDKLYHNFLISINIFSPNLPQQTELDVGDNIWKMRQNRNDTHQVATGGKENDMKVWDLNNPTEPIFKVKNVSTVKVVIFARRYCRDLPIFNCFACF